MVDYRGSNRITKRNSTAVPESDDLFDRIGQARVFSKIDLKTGFRQIRIDQNDVEKTAFMTKYGQFEFLVTGLCNGPATFQTLMNSVFPDVIYVYLVVYLNDILMFSYSEKEHMKHVSLVLRGLKENELVLYTYSVQFFVLILCSRLHGVSFHKKSYEHISLDYICFVLPVHNPKTFISLCQVLRTLFGFNRVFSLRTQFVSSASHSF